MSAQKALKELEKYSGFIKWFKNLRGVTIREYEVEKDPQAEGFVPFPVDLLPNPLSNFIKCVAYSTPCDASMVALPVLVTCSAAIGGSRGVFIKNGWFDPPTLWGAVVARSGTVKSPILKQAVQPLDDIDAELMASDAGRCIVEDITIEALGVLLKENQRGLLMSADELATWFSSFIRYSSKGVDSSPQWLQLYNFGNSRIDRKTGDKSGARLAISVKDRVVSVLGGIQPSVLAQHFTRGFRNSGGAARFLFVMPPRYKKRFVDYETPLEVTRAYADTIRSLHALQFINEKPGRIPFDAIAKPRFAEFVDSWGKKTHTAEEDEAAFLSKLESVAARLALIHCLCTDSTATKIPLHSLEAGIAMTHWFADEAARVYKVLDGGDDTEKEIKAKPTFEAWLRTYMKEKGYLTIDLRQLQRCSKFANAKEAKEAIQSLVDAGVGVWTSEKQTNFQFNNGE